MSDLKPMRIGLIGVGYISPAYINGCRLFDIIEIAACADLNMDRARAVAAEFNIPKAVTIDELLTDPEIELVVNLTTPMAHAEITQRILRAGKHVWSEKPLAVTLEEADKIAETARTYNLRVGCAPDTTLFGEYQMARKLIDDGAIGTPVAATVFMGTSGPERWHPSVDFYYQPGGGPLLDIGPYFIGSLILFFGSVSRVTAITRDTSHQRTALDGHQINIQVKTHISGTLEFESGVVATLITSFEMPAHHMPWTELHGTGGSLLFPSPPWGDDLTVQVYEPEQRQWIPKPSVFRLDWRRGIGVADMVHALRSGRPHRTSFEVAYHSLEVMNGILKAGETHQLVAIISRCERPAPLPVGLTGRALD